MTEAYLDLLQKDIAVHNLKPYQNLIAALIYGSKSVVEITGTAVGIIKRATVLDYLHALLSQIISHVGFDNSKASNTTFYPHHLAIIADNYNSYCLITKFRKYTGIQCGSCEEQIDNSSLLQFALILNRARLNDL
jgi:hypothetical protein